MQKPMLSLAVALGLAAATIVVPAQAQLGVKTYEFGKSAYGFHGALGKSRITTFQAEGEAVAIFRQIIGNQGLSATTIEIRASGDVANAAAFVDGDGKRVIAYNTIFMQEVKDKTGRYWALISILAHEVGHHLNFHTYTPGQPPPAQSHNDELEADYFSGHALARMGATLEDALSAMRKVALVEETATHPGRDARLQAIALGWKAASAASPTASVSPPPTTPTPFPTAPAAPPPPAAPQALPRPSERELQAPIDNLYAAWRTLDVERYLAQWAPDAVKIDLKAGTRQSGNNFKNERRALFARLSAADAQYKVQFRGFRDGVGEFDVSYSFNFRFKSGSRAPDRACESYRVRRYGNDWLIFENVDYKPCS